MRMLNNYLGLMRGKQNVAIGIGDLKIKFHFLEGWRW